MVALARVKGAEPRNPLVVVGFRDRLSALAVIVALGPVLRARCSYSGLTCGECSRPPPLGRPPCATVLLSTLCWT